MAGRSWEDPWRRYAESRPLAAVDGVATSKQRGSMASTWWSKRFVDMLDSYGLGGRMQRGRRYARSGQVLTVEVTSGVIMAQVQGSRRTPYLASIRCPQPVAARWSAVEGELQNRVGLVARLLAGEVPVEMEPICGEAGIDLFPSSWPQLGATCNCPDWENPCKHLAAVLYVFADQLDADPWLLFAWHGRTRDELLSHLESISPSQRDGGLPAWWPLVPGRSGVDRQRWRPPQPTLPDRGDRILDRLGPLDATYGAQPLVDVIRAAYGALVDPDAEGESRTQSRGA